MVNVIVAFSKEEDAGKIKRILTRHGFHVASVCRNGSQILSAAEGLGSGIVVCGFRFADNTCQEIRDALSSRFDVLTIASPSRWEGESREGMVCLPMPLQVQDLTDTLYMMSRMLEQRLVRMKSQKAGRSAKERQLIDQAKALLMERNRMSEEEAHRYIQKCSMDSGTNMAETAGMVLRLYQ